MQIFRGEKKCFKDTKEKRESERKADREKNQLRDEKRRIQAEQGVVPLKTAP